jgi:glycosyltransferase involved in cell wall biosynthesis
MDKRLVIITQKVDEHDDLLGFFVEWIRELARHFDHIDVVALGVGKYHLPHNVKVYSLGKENGVSKVAQAWRAIRLLFKVVPQSCGVFAHMSPVFAIVAYPFALIWRKKLILWYLHRSLTLKLKLAAWMSDTVLTADKQSLTLKSSKIIEVGHGVDAHVLAVSRSWQNAGPLRLVAVGRLSPIKNFETFIRAVALVRKQGIDLQATIVGKPVMAADRDYAEGLQSLVHELGVQDSISFRGFVPHDQIRSVYEKADIVVGLTPPGGIDKVMLEGMAAGCLPVTSNAVMKKYFTSFADTFTFKHGDPEDLAKSITFIAGLTPEIKQQASQAMVESVKTHHNLTTLAQRMSALFIS